MQLFYFSNLISSVVMLYSQGISVRLSFKFTGEEILKVFLYSDSFELCWCLFSDQTWPWTYHTILSWAIECCNWKPFLFRVHRCSVFNTSICPISINLPCKTYQQEKLKVNVIWDKPHRKVKRWKEIISKNINKKLFCPWILNLLNLLHDLLIN